MKYSLGIGLTNDCNLSCEHCYRPTDSIYSLSLEQVTRVCDSIPVGSVGLGTGENALHPDFLSIVAFLYHRGIKLSMASNGYSLNTIPEEYLRFFSDVELSVDFPNEDEQDAFRGYGNWRDVHKAIARSQRAGIHVSILTTMMNTNYTRMNELTALSRSLGVHLRVNVYQPVYKARFRLSYEQFWEGFRRLLGTANLASCTEPVVSAALGLGSTPTCAHESIRITPQGYVIPCVYWPNHDLYISDLERLGESILDTEEFIKTRQVPPVAKQCLCQGGCAGRRALLGDLNQHDLYCPWVRGEHISLSYTAALSTELVRKRNYCTTIVG